MCKKNYMAKKTCGDLACVRISTSRTLSGVAKTSSKSANKNLPNSKISIHGLASGQEPLNTRH